MAYRAFRNPGESEAAAVDQLLETPVSSDLVAAPASDLPAPVVPEEVALEEATAVAVASEAPFVPYAPELLVGLRPAVLAKIQNLEATITKLSTAARGAQLERTYQRLIHIHDERIQKMLEKRLVRRERFKGRGPRAQRLIQKHRVHRANVLTQRYQTKVANVQQIRTAYQSGQISGQRAQNLMTAVIRPGVQMPGLAASQHPIAAEHPVGAAAVVAVNHPIYASRTW